MIFEDKRKLLELYNAISGKHYEDPELLEINTLENAIYMSMKNDLSFLIDARLSLYEHQSTYSPNLPLRFLFYLSDMFSGMTVDANLYGTKKVELPAPRFVVFYNGEADQPDRQILKLSDLYTVKEEDPMLDLKVLMLNVNQGHNPELMEVCHTLWEYAEYTGRVRKYAKEQPIAEAVERAITECIREGILKEFLEKNRREAKNVSIYEYDQEKHIRQEREEAWEAGEKAGWEAGEKAGWEAGREAGEKTGREAGERAGQINKLQELIRKKLAKGKTIPEIAEALEEEEDTIRRLVEEMKDHSGE
ncbi:hypothetical protein [Massilistercora timonensis]|uniref:hypothetical protein n=1 Tax=Massilistercora timonensis TaxID=2086584 RepID=UPI003207C92A